MKHEGPAPKNGTREAGEGSFIVTSGADFRSQLAVLLDELGSPIPTGRHSEVIGEFYDRARALGLRPDVAELLTDLRGEDCVPKWGSLICTNDPCPQDCAGRGRCADYVHAFPHRLRAGASMRHDAKFDVSGAA